MAGAAQPVSKRKIIQIKDVLAWVDEKFDMSLTGVQLLRNALQAHEYTGESLSKLRSRRKLQKLGVLQKGVQELYIAEIKKLKAGEDPRWELRECPAPAAEREKKRKAPEIPGHVEQLLEAMAVAELEPIDGSACKLLVLKDSKGGKVHWPGLNDNILFVRPVFETLFEAIIPKVKPPKGTKPHTLLRGIPGIGKSSFGLYLLWRLLKAGRNVSYRYPKALGEVEIEVGQVRDMLDIRIVDGCKPKKGLWSTTILISSPGGGQKKIYEEFRKDCHRVYMPGLTNEEIETLRSTCFSRVSSEIMKERIEKAGNVPRTVLSENADEELEELEELLFKLPVEALELFAKTRSDDIVVEQISFRVVHYEIDESLKKKCYRWASPYIENLAAERIIAADTTRSWKILGQLMKDEVLFSMTGKLFEKWCDMSMAAGSDEFKIRQLGLGSIKMGSNAAVPPEQAADKLSKLLKAADSMLQVRFDTGPVGTLRIPSSQTLHLKSIGEIQPSHLPKHRFVTKAGFAAANFIEACGVCSNSTISSKHELVVQGKCDERGLYPIMMKLKDNLDSEEAVPFFWLVPPTVFDKIKAAIMTVASPKAAGEDVANRAAALAAKVVQYAVEIPLPLSVAPRLNCSSTHSADASDPK